MTHQACGDGGRAGAGAARKRSLTRGRQPDRSTWLSKCFGLSTAARPCALHRAVRSFLVDPRPKDHAIRRLFCDSRGTSDRARTERRLQVSGTGWIPPSPFVQFKLYQGEVFQYKPGTRDWVESTQSETPESALRSERGFRLSVFSYTHLANSPSKSIEILAKADESGCLAQIEEEKDAGFSRFHTHGVVGTPWRTPLRPCL